MPPPTPLYQAVAASASTIVSRQTSMGCANSKAEVPEVPEPTTNTPGRAAATDAAAKPGKNGLVHSVSEEPPRTREPRCLMRQRSMRVLS